jgi:hypothetical protein
MMKALPGLDGFERRNKAPKRNPAPYCFGCSQEMAAKHLTKTRCRSFPFLGREEARLRVMRYLFSRCWLADISLLCDHYRICRVCLDPNARVDSPGEHCDAWQDVQGCTSCGQPRRIFLENGDGLFCMPCLRVWRARRGWWRKSKYRRVDPETGALLSRPRRFQCFEPPRRATAKYCSPCRDLLRSRPGKKCKSCGPQPRPRAYTRCDACRKVGRTRTLLRDDFDPPRPQRKRRTTRERNGPPSPSIDAEQPDNRSRRSRLV